jgi:hypothetical protein
MEAETKIQYPDYHYLEIETVLEAIQEAKGPLAPKFL